MNKKQWLALAGAPLLALAGQNAMAACSDVTRTQLSQAAANVLANDSVLTGGLGNNMWVTMVDETGKICHVVNTAGAGQRSSETWGLSRIISAQKANTSAMLSLGTGPATVQAWASGALFLASQPVLDPATGLVSANVGGLQGSLYGVQHSNPVDASRAYAGSPTTYGTDGDPLKNKRIGGINVFGGGLPLYVNGVKIGAIGVSGDTSCTDHAFAWRVRERLATSAGVDDAATVNTNNGGVSEVLDITGNKYPGCGGPASNGAGGLGNGIL